MIDIDIRKFLCHAIRQLLVSISQSSYLIYFNYNFFDRAKETYMKKTEETTLADIDLLYFPSFFKKKTNNLIAEDNPLEKVLIVEEDLDCTDIDDVGNLKDLPKLVFIHEECQNLEVVNDGRELIRNINQKKKSEIFASL